MVGAVSALRIGHVRHLGYTSWGLSLPDSREGSIMAITIQATYENGVLKPGRPLTLLRGRKSV